MKRIILNLFAAAALLSSTLGAANAQEKSMKNESEFQQIFPLGNPLPNEFSKYFIGQAYLAPLTSDTALGVPVANVTFSPACRNNWHSHTGGQLLICTAGRGYYQQRGSEARELRAGDVVEIAPDVEHWHGAAPDSWFAHLAIECNPSTNKNRWLEAVDDTWYAAATSRIGLNQSEATQERQFTFRLNDNVVRHSVKFRNRYGITIAGDMYMPRNIEQRSPAIAVCGPFGAVKEQASGLYANELASRGFIALAFDPSFTGESGGEPRSVASPDINTEDFCAAVDFLSTLETVNPEAIGIVGICGWGGMAINAAAIDTRIKATVASTMYDMTRVTANGYFDAENSGVERMAKRRALNAQRTEDYRNGSYALAGGVADTLPADAPQFVKDYYAYYKTSRGYHPNSLNSNNGWNITSALSFLNMPILSYADEIESAVLVVHGEKAHSRYFGEDAFKKLRGANKELIIVPNASHTDLYDNLDAIPFERIATFFRTNLK